MTDKAKYLRKLILTSSTQAGSGHPTSSLSSADIASSLFDSFFYYDIKNPKNPLNDRFILSKGHASPLYYSLWAMANGIEINELNTLRKFNSRLEGHPTFNFPFTDVATGSLGQGLSVGNGMALFAKKENLPFKTYVLLGDGEMAEGSVWEALNFASHYKLDNLIAIVDVNRLAQSGETMFGHNTEEYEKRLKAFGWETTVIDGHNNEEIHQSFQLAIENKSGKPFVIIAKTIKGKGISFLEDKDNWHGKALTNEELAQALVELGTVDESLRFTLKNRENTFSQHIPNTSIPLQISYKLGEEIATREVYGQILATLGKEDTRIYTLDGDVKNSTYSESFKKEIPDRFIECFIAEQNMVGVATGLSALSQKPFVSTFAAFLTRAHDQIRMSAYSKASIAFVGSHAGVSIGEDGSSQMGLEDFAMFGSIPEAILFHPSDAVSTAKIIALQAGYNGLSYLRTLRPKTPVLYSTDEEFKIGGSKILRSSDSDMLTLAACGITVHEALKAYDMLQKEGISVCVIDCYSVNPIDKQTLQKSVESTKRPVIVTVEDHYIHGGFGDFVLSAFAMDDVLIEKMGVNKIPRSGKKDEVLDYVEISASHIVSKIKSLL